MSNNFDTFRDLPEELQKTAIREGEAWLEAQLHTANSADQRALTWAGFLIAAATAALGGGIALISKSAPDYILSVIALAYAGGCLLAAWFAVMTAQPKAFSFPGNRPGNWLPAEWDCVGDDQEKIGCARCDQAKHIDKAIIENAKIAKKHGEDMSLSMAIGFYATLLAGLAIALLILARAVF